MSAVTPLPVRDNVVTTSAASLRREYVAGGVSALTYAYARLLNSLTWAIDDTTRDFGDDLYERMALDPVISATLTILIASIVEDGAKLNAAVTDPKDPDYDLSQRITAHATAMLANMTTPLDNVLWDLGSATYLGNRVAETVWDYVTHDGRRYLDIIAIKVKPRQSVAFVVDVYGNLVGLQAVVPGRAGSVATTLPTPGGTVDKGQGRRAILPRHKFIIASFRPRENDPRGTSVLRPAFSTWVDKIQTLAERQKHMARFASPGLIGRVADKAQPIKIVDAHGNDTGRVVDPLDALFQGLITFHNGTALALPYGTEVDLVEAKGNGDVYDLALGYDDRQLVKVILTQTLATEDSPHQARAAAQVHQGTLNTIVQQSKKTFSTALREDALKVWVQRNYGDDKAHLAPYVTLGKTEAPDLAKMMTSVAALFKSGFPAPSQLTTLDELLNLPARLAEEIVVPKPEDGEAGDADQGASPATPDDSDEGGDE